MGVPLVVFFDGVAQDPSTYSVGSTGLITFTTPPTVGVVVSVTSGFYFQCRFAEDNRSFQKVLSRWWTRKSLKFSSIKL
jgi:hypothetical protein